VCYGDDFVWDKDNEAKIARKHCVDRYEAEDAARDPDATVRRQGEDRFGNPRYIYVGKTLDGRILFVVVDRKGAHLWRIGTARNATFQEKRAYRGRNR
jgi:uncharacterized DUF497 family protein